MQLLRSAVDKLEIDQAPNPLDISDPVIVSHAPPGGDFGSNWDSPPRQRVLIPQYVLPQYSPPGDFVQRTFEDMHANEARDAELLKMHEMRYESLKVVTKIQQLCDMLPLLVVAL